MLLTAPAAPTLKADGKNLCLAKITAGGKITPTVATLTISQEFTNGDKLADVTYHCPLHPDWAVHAVTLRCGERTIHTVVMPNQKAQETFDSAKQAGHTAVLAKEVASDELQLQLANVPAGEIVQVTTEVVAWPLVEANRGSFIIPLINGPKYGGTEAQQPFLDENDHEARHTTCHLDLELAVPGASVDIGTITDDRLSGEIDPVGQITVTFDAQPSALYHEDETGKYLVVGVPAVRPDGERVPSRKAFLIDRSGSMGGQGMAVASEVSRQIADRIGDELKFVYAFDDKCEPIWAKDLGLRNGRKQNISAIDAISHISVRGSTELKRALLRVHADLRGQIDDLILVTDALTRQSEYTELVTAVKALTEDGIAVHVILVGPNPGRFIGECITHASGGLYIEASGSHFDKKELDDCVTRFLRGGTTLLGIGVGDDITPCPHPVRGRPVMVAITPSGRPDEITVKLDGLDLKVPVTDAKEARFIWAREMVMGTVRAAWARGESIDQHKDAIEKIGVEHQILTPFTSMVGLDASVTHDRTDVNETIAQASLPVGMDASAFYGLQAGGDLSMNAAGALGQMRRMGGTTRGLIAAQSTMSYSASARGQQLNSGTKSARPRMALYESGGDRGFDGLVPQEMGLMSQDLGDTDAFSAFDDATTIVGRSLSTPGGDTDDNVGNRTASLLAAILANGGKADPFDGISVALYGVAAIIAAVNALRNAGVNDLAHLLSRFIVHAGDVILTGVNITHTADQIDDLANQIAAAHTATGTR